VATSVADFVGDAFAILGASAPQFSGSARPGDPARYLADISRAQALGWRPRVDVKQGIREYVSWFLEQE
jgi:UDP-glucose 4-epimerase